MTIWAATGHRPNRLGGYSERQRLRLVRFAEAILERIMPEKIYTGMALGWDQAVAAAALNLDIPFVAVIPFRGQETKWPVESKNRFHVLCEEASEVKVLRERYHPKAFFERNEYMVHEAESILVLLDPDVGEGGTRHCYEFARRQEKRAINVWDKWCDFQKEPN